VGTFERPGNLWCDHIRTQNSTMSRSERIKKSFLNEYAPGPFQVQETPHTAAVTDHYRFDHELVNTPGGPSWVRFDSEHRHWPQPIDGKWIEELPDMLVALAVYHHKVVPAPRLSDSIPYVIGPLRGQKVCGTDAHYRTKIPNGVYLWYPSRYVDYGRLDRFIDSKQKTDGTWNIMLWQVPNVTFTNPMSGYSTYLQGLSKYLFRLRVDACSTPIGCEGAGSESRCQF
jgi:hypothetical protein